MAWSGEQLPEDMVVEILSKFSDKTLVRMTSTCKAWYKLVMKNPNLHEKYSSILRDHYCTKTFFRRWLDGENIIYEDSLITHDSRDPKSIEFDRLRDIEAYDKVLGACNGVLLCIKKHRFYLHNPITREVLPIPPVLPRVTDECGDIGGLERSFDAFFGFDSSDNDYKIILCRFGYAPRICKRYADIYKVSTNCWSKLDDVEFEFGKYQPKSGREGVFLKGFFHGLEYECERALPTGPEHILTFDMGSERFGVMEYPSLARENLDWGEFLVVLEDDSLALCVRKSQSEFVEIWVITEYGKEESWTKKFSVKLLGDFELFGKVCTFWASGTSFVMLSAYCDESEDFDGTEGRWFAALQVDGKYQVLDAHRGCHLIGFGFQPSLASIK